MIQLRTIRDYNCFDKPPCSPPASQVSLGLCQVKQGQIAEAPLRGRPHAPSHHLIKSRTFLVVLVQAHVLVELREEGLHAGDLPLLQRRAALQAPAVAPGPPAPWRTYACRPSGPREPGAILRRCDRSAFRWRLSRILASVMHAPQVT